MTDEPRPDQSSSAERRRGTRGLHQLRLGRQQGGRRCLRGARGVGHLLLDSAAQRQARRRLCGKHRRGDPRCPRPVVHPLGCGERITAHQARARPGGGSGPQHTAGANRGRGGGRPVRVLPGRRTVVRGLAHADLGAARRSLRCREGPAGRRSARRPARAEGDSTGWSGATRRVSGGRQRRCRHKLGPPLSTQALRTTRQHHVGRYGCAQDPLGQDRRRRVDRIP